MDMHRSLLYYISGSNHNYVVYFFSLDLHHVHNSWNNSPTTKYNINYIIFIDISIFKLIITDAYPTVYPVSPHFRDMKGKNFYIKNMSRK